MLTEGYVLLTLSVEEADGQYAAYCPELGVATCGDTEEEAFANLDDAITVHLNALEEVGAREEFFRERNITMRPTRTAPLKVSRTINQRIPASV